MPAFADKDDAEKSVEMWKVKRLIKSLEAARGNGTSMITLIIPVSMFCCVRPSDDYW